MTELEKIINGLEKAKMVIEQWIPMFEQYNTPTVIDEAIVILKEQKETELCDRCGRRRLKSNRSIEKEQVWQS